MTDSILTTLGAGSGIDTGKLVTDLVAATRQPRQKRIDAQTAVNSARLSGLSQLANAVTAIADSTRTRVRGLADSEITSFVEDMVAALNELRGQVSTQTRIGSDGVGGPLTADRGVRALSRALASFAGATVPGVALRLSDIGVSTARDGSLSFDEARLAAALVRDPAGVKAMLGIGSTVTSGIAASLQTIKFAMTGSGGALTEARSVYTRTTAAIARSTARLDSDLATLTDRLTVSYAAMNRNVGAIKASQAYLKQQVDAWSAK